MTSVVAGELAGDYRLALGTVRRPDGADDHDHYYEQDATVKLARYMSDHGPRIGIVVDDRLVDAHELGYRQDLDEILGGGTDLWAAMSAAARADGRRAMSIHLSELLAPIPRPRKYFAVGMNTRDHLAEVSGGTTARAQAAHRRNQLVAEAYPDPRFAMIFNKQVSCISGPHAPIWLPRKSTYLDYEGEVAVVIGRRVRDADESAARAAIAGYTVANDVSVRDWQTTTSQAWLGKSFDTHGPIGPWMVTADEFDPGAAEIRTWVNGELRQSGTLTDQILSPEAIVSQISQVCTLEPGDLIATGTPAGVGAVQEKWLTLGDRVRVEVTGIGAIENEVVNEPGGSAE
ncbi:fumarylacetoacetate hydrolase family protein [Gordonia terrae]